MAASNEINPSLCTCKYHRKKLHIVQMMIVGATGIETRNYTSDNVFAELA